MLAEDCRCFYDAEEVFVYSQFSSWIDVDFCQSICQCQLKGSLNNFVESVNRWMAMNFLSETNLAFLRQTLLSHAVLTFMYIAVFIWLIFG